MDIVLFLLMPGTAAVAMAALVALAPAILSRWRDRALLARGSDDPALPERLRATRWWTLLGTAIAVAILVVVWPWQALWAVPLLAIARRWTAYWLRRATLGESWSFWLYLSFVARTGLGLVAPTLVLLVTPLIVSAAEDGAARWMVAITMAALLMLWHVRVTRLLLWLWQATPIARDDLDAAFAGIIARTALPTPRVWQAGPPGAVVANAVALPALAGSHVVISRTLLECLTIDEIAAIYAHEVAHLEFFNRTRLRRMRGIAFVLIVYGALLVPLLAAAAPAFVPTAITFWPAILLISAIARSVKVHGNELASDRRAVELCGNPDALMSALTKLHAISRQPRRWNPRATKHPSLAQRLRAIRIQAGFLAPAIEQIEIFPSPSGDAFLLLDGAMLQHASGVPPRATNKAADKGAASAIAAAASGTAIAPARASDTRSARDASGTTGLTSAYGIASGAFASVGLPDASDTRSARDASGTTGLTSAYGIVSGTAATAGLSDASDAPGTPGTSDTAAVTAALPVLPDAGAILAHAQSVRRVTYVSLASCRIVVAWNAPVALQVLDRGGRRFEAQIRDADLPRLHDLLDVIEFGMPVDTPAPLVNERVIALGLLIVSLTLGQIWSLALLAALALIRPAAEMLIGAALALSLAGLLQWIDPTAVAGAGSNPLPAWVVIALGGVAVDLVLWRLWSGRGPAAKAPVWCVASVLGAAAIVWLHGLLQWDGSLLRLAQVARVTPAAMLLPLAAAVLMARARVRGRRVLAAALAIAALVPAAITTRWFQDEIVRDPLLSAAAPLPVTSSDVDMIGLVAASAGNELRLSPEGQSIATAERDEDSGTIADFTIRTSDQKTHDVHAADLAFLDDNRALLLVHDGEGLALRLETFAERIAEHSADARVEKNAQTSAAKRGEKGAEKRAEKSAEKSSEKNTEKGTEKSGAEWSLTLPGLRWSRLSLSPQTQHWRVIGRDNRGQIVRLQGTVGQTDYDDVRWKVDERGEALVGSGNAMLVSRTDWRASLLGRLLPELAMATSRRSSFDVSVWRVRAGAPTLMARSSADVDCVEAPVDLEPAVCFAFDGIATRIWTLSADDKRVTPIGMLHGYARPLTRSSDGTLVAWWRRHPVLLQLDPLRARELSTIPISRWARAAFASNHLLIADDPGGEAAAIYRVQSELTSSAHP
jgi:Zn-dependent protease with chaperone function